MITRDWRRGLKRQKQNSEKQKWDIEEQKHSHQAKQWNRRKIQHICTEKKIQQIFLKKVLLKREEVRNYITRNCAYKWPPWLAFMFQKVFCTCCNRSTGPTSVTIVLQEFQCHVQLMLDISCNWIKIFLNLYIKPECGRKWQNLVSSSGCRKKADASSV